MDSQRTLYPLSPVNEGGWIRLVQGDFNTRAPEWGSRKTNERGKRLLDTAVSLGMVLSKTGVSPTFPRNGATSIIDVTFMSESLVSRCIDWQINFHSGQREELCYLLGVATEKYPMSVELWRLRLRFHLCKDEEQNAMAVFKGALMCLYRDPASTLCLWKMFIQYYQTKSASKVAAIFLEGIRQPPAVSSVLKQMFLEWLVLTKDINAARKAYQLMCDQPPFCRELYQKMASLECLQPEVELPRVIKCYELACEQIGKNSRPEEYYCNVSSSKMAL